MKMYYIALVMMMVSTMMMSIDGACDNACSGHGTCTLDDVCNCYDNWGVGLAHDSGDCSERVCPYELAWVDTPNYLGRVHKYAECAGRGICNRETGECACFDGYEGKGCQRMSCPNSCSGHGTCEYIQDMPYMKTYSEWADSSVAWTNDMTDGKPSFSRIAPVNAQGVSTLADTVYSEVRRFHYGFSADAKTFDYRNWDTKKARGCVCDATYGDVDCSKKMCPYGTDVLDFRLNSVYDANYQVQKIKFVALTGGIDSLKGRTFALQFVSKLNETFTTIPIVFPNCAISGEITDAVSDIELALLQLPNRVIDGVSVSYLGGGTNGVVTTATANSVTTATDTSFNFLVTFTGPSVQGPQHALTVLADECQRGCTPKIDGLNLETRISIDSSTSLVTETLGSAVYEGDYISQQSGKGLQSNKVDYNSYECGRRGKCDYTTGLCACFNGYTGEACNIQTTLV